MSLATKESTIAISLFFSVSIIIIFTFLPNTDYKFLAYGSSFIVNSSTTPTTNMIPSTMKTTTNASSFLDNIETKKVKVGDIEMAYKIFGRGPIMLLIMGSGGTMNEWDPTLLRGLSSNHTIVLFDNRGFGDTSFGIKNFTISQFANDTSGLIDAIGIKKPVDLLGISLGGFIAQELALSHPDKVDRLVIFASSCSGKIAVPPAPVASTPIEQIKIIAEGLFPQQWMKEHPNYISYIPIPKESVNPKSAQLQGQAVDSWKGTCDRVLNINKSTLVMVGSNDIVLPPANSVLLAEKIPGAWLVQIKGGGHGVMWQYPEKVIRILETFLSTTS